MSHVQADESISRVAFWPFWFAGRIVGTLLFLAVFALVMFVSAAHWHWPASLDGQSVSVTPAFLQVVLERSITQAPSSQLAEQFSQASYTGFIKWTGVHRMALSDSTDTTALVPRLIHRAPEEVAAAMIAAQVFGARLANAVLSFPLVLFVLLLASVDGIAERAIRRACAGHESATVFRLTRRFAYKLLPPAVGLLYLCLPYDLTLGTVMLPALAITAVLVRTKWKYYKKHI